MHADLRKLGVKNGLALLKMESQWFKKVLLIFSSDLIFQPSNYEVMNSAETNHFIIRQG